jgi:hypothetical protein
MWLYSFYVTHIVYIYIEVFKDKGLSLNGKENL